jgi:glycosyltransferase involved in cell wall biosynthesis
MPTVLQINVCVNSGSTGKIAEQIGLLAMQHGWDSYIAYGRYINSSKSYTIQVGDKTDWIFHAIMTRLFDRHGLSSTRATRKLIKQIQTIKPDIIHLHNIHGYYINYKVLFEYLRRTNTPVVWTLHDCWSMTGHCTHFEYAKCDRWKTECYDCPEKKLYPSSFFLDRSRKNYIEKRELFTSVKNMTIVPVSKWLGDVVKDSFLKDYDVEVIQNGIDIQTFYPMQSDIKERYGIPVHKKIILGVASPWTQRKGFDDFLKLYELLPQNRYQIVIIGLSDKQCKQLPNGIIGLHRTHSVKELAKWYSSADVFVNPTYEDSYPTTNLEAISCGTPVVTYKTGGSPETVARKTGRVVEKYDLSALLCAIDELCGKDREEVSKHCREYAVLHFDKKDCFGKYIKLYEKLINQKIPNVNL